jgi:flagellar hook-associated protein FlgK
MYIEMANTAKNASDKIRQGRVNWLLEFRQKQIEREMNNRLGKLAQAA